MKKPKPNSKKRKKQANHFSFQYVYKYKNWLLLTILLVIPFLFVLPSNSVVRTDTCGTVGSLQNGSFEDFTVGTANSPSGQNFWHGYAGGPNMFLFLPDDEDDTPNGLPNWKTTATDDTIELQRQISSYTSYTNISNVTNTYSPARSGLQTGSLNSSNYFDLYGPQPAAGNHWAELNANQSAALYQDIVFSGGSNVFWSLKHRGRYFGSGSVYNRTDEMRVEIGPVGTLTEQTTIRKFAPTNSDRFTGEPTFSTTSTSVSTIQTSLTDGWNMYQGQYTVPGSGNQTIRFQFRSNTSGSGGNLLDNIEFTPFLACPVTRTVTFGTPDTLNAVTTAGVTYGVNQTITSTTSATNPNGSAGSVSRSGNEITFTPVSAGNSQTVDYTASMTFSGTTYTDEARITYNVSATVPGSPTSLSATPSGSQVVLSWTAPSNNGGVAISDYVVEFQEGSGSWQTFSDGVSSSTSATITGLTGSSNYNFRVSAKNDGSGYSGPGTTGTGSTSSTLAVNAWLPGAPTLNTPSSPSSTSVDLTWSAPASVGLSAITSYFLEYRLFSDTTWTSINTGNTNTSRTISSLTANQTYVFRISATNSQGTGAASSTQTITLGANCSAGSSSTISNSTTVIVTFNAPTQTTSSHNSGDCDWVVPDNVFIVDYLVVGGGGGGASGGGGGGGVVTSWSSYNASDNSERSARATPLSVNPGETIDVSIGGGGANGSGGSLRCTYSGSTNNACNFTHFSATKGSDSSFGSVTAEGGGIGGRGGENSGRGGAGGSGGGSAYDTGEAATSANASSVVGANSFGNAGGTSVGAGYNAGAGGGGAGTNASTVATSITGNGGIGGNRRIINYCGSATAVGNGSTSTSTDCTGGGGGNGGRGVRSNIESLDLSTFTEFGCGGGGGLNNNSATVIPGAGGSPGCNSAGTGSNWATFLTTTSNTYSGITSTQFNGTVVASDGFGGGGGGTDPEGDTAGDGGSGRVIIRYTLVDSNCPNDDNATVTTPIACPTSVSIQADGASTSVQVRTSPISFSTSANSPTLSVLTRPVANPTSGNLSATVSGANINISVPSGSSLIGGTYAVTYRLTEGSNTSDSYILVTVEDPTQITPIVIPIDPRAREVNLSKFILGASTNVLVCVLDSDDDSYSSIPQFSIPTPIPSVTPSTRSTPNGLSLRGARTQVEPQTSNIVVSRASGDTRLVPGLNSRFLKVNVSNTANGGNNSCEGGTESTIEIKPIDISLIDVVNLILGR